MLDYDELNSLLIHVQAGARAAECHGFLCGQICVTGANVAEAWHDYLLADIDGDEQLHECHTELSDLASIIEAQIDSPDLDFQLLMPDDEHSLVERSKALAEWCAGFLGGLGTAGIGQDHEMSGECNEIVDDIARIARIRSAESEDEESESALMELVEYIRIGVLMLYQELRIMTVLSDDKPEVLH